MIILRIARKLISHVDPKAPLECTLRLLEEHRFGVKDVTFYETIGLPLSGGYVGMRLMPAIDGVERAVAGLNRILSAAVNRGHLGKFSCWRYIVQADAP